MANVKITDLNAYTDPASTDVLPIVDVVTDETKKVSIADLMENAGTGSEVAPSIAFDGDANTGVWRPGPDSIAISTGGTKRFEISATGAVTIPGNLTAAAFIPSGSSVPTNGVYLPSSNNVAISTNSTGRLFIDSSGRVGIGTSPSYFFHVKGGNNNVANIDNDGSQYTNLGISNNGTEKAALYWDNTNTLLDLGSNTANSQLIFRAAGSERARIDSSGRLGVGNSSPTSLLSVGDSSSHFIGLSNSASFYGSGGQITSSVSTAGVYSTETAAVDVGGVLAFGGKTSNTAAVYPFAFIQGAKASATAGDYSGYLRFFTVPSNGSSPVERVRIDSSGRLGVGTSAPEGLFQVTTGGQYENLLFNSNAANTSILRFGGASDGEGPYLFQSAATSEFRIANDLPSGVITFGTGSSSTERARIDSSGRLLVGTSSARSDFFNSTYTPQFQLASAGNGEKSSIALVSAGNGAYNEPNLIIAKSRGNAIGDDTAVQSGDFIGAIQFQGSDGSEFVGAASITALVDDTPGANDMPGRLVFSTTADGASSPTERMRIQSDGNIRLTSSNAGINNATATINVYESGGSRAGFLGFSSGGAVLLHDSGNTNPIRFFQNGSEAARIDGSGRLLVGTSSGSGSSRVDIVGNSSSATTEGVLQLRRGSDALFAENALGIINFGDTISGGNARAQIVALADATGGTGDLPARLEFRTTADGASTATERMSIRNTGEVRIESNLWNKGAIYLGPSGQDSSRFYTSSTGGSSTTMYIGNAAIQVSSDARLKENIEDTNLDALNAISKIKVKDFTWNDPSDASPNNRNARGTWTGLIAQELVEVLPFVVNAPRNEDDGSIDYESEDIWTLDQSQLCPVLIKAVQQQQEIIASLEARLSALEAQ